MWLYTTIGFFSVVTGESDGDAQTLQIRARCASHLTALVDLCSELREFKMSCSSHGSYPYRIVASRAVVEGVIARLVREIDYPNFKAACAQRGVKNRGSRTGGLYNRLLHLVHEAAAKMLDGAP